MKLFLMGANMKDGRAYGPLSVLNREMEMIKVISVQLLCL